ncbi:CHAT domain-containing protein [Rostrohypoxylon terebratum]|nr:CHAT domain-containing protein [Rostrohypoxylon terebratum]
MILSESEYNEPKAIVPLIMDMLLPNDSRITSNSVAEISAKILKDLHHEDAKIQHGATLLRKHIDLIILLIKTNQPEEAIDLAKLTIDKIPTDFATRSQLLSIIGDQLRCKYEGKHEESDLNKAIQYYEEAVVAANMVPDNNGRLAIAHGLQRALEVRYKLHDRKVDLDQIISSLEVAIEKCDSKDMAKEKCHLAMHLASRYLIHEPRLETLNQAIEFGMLYKDLPAKDPFRLKVLDQLIVLLLLRSENSGQQEVLDQAMRLVQSEEARLKPFKPLHLHNVALVFVKRYEYTGDISQINEAIKVAENTADSCGMECEEKRTVLSNLGSFLLKRYVCTGDRNALKRAIPRCHEALDTKGPGELGKRNLLYTQETLAENLFNLHRYTGDPQDLDSAIDLWRGIVARRSVSEVLRHRFLHRLGACLGWSYKNTGDIQELDEAIEITKEAIQSAPPGRARDLYATSMCRFLQLRYDKTHSPADLKDAEVYVFKVAGRMTDKSLKTIICRGVFEVRKRQYEKSKQLSLLGDAVKALRLAIEADSSPSIDRISIVEIIGLHSQRALREINQQCFLYYCDGLSSTAAAAALEDGRSKEHALKLLEHGRIAINNLLLQKRPDISLLYKKHPEWAKNFQELRDALDLPFLDHATRLKQPAEQHLDLVKQFASLLGEIRGDKEFSNFLSLPEVLTLRSAAQSGETVVVINVSRFRSDAFLIFPASIETIHLSKLTYNDILRAVKRFRSSQEEAFEVLEWLWESVDPILDLMGVCKSNVGRKYDEWPRIYWVPTGPLRLLPLHAADYHRERSHRTVLDRAISSYSMSVGEITYGRELNEKWPYKGQEDHRKHRKSGAPRECVVVSMDNIPGHDALEFAAQEARAVTRFLLHRDNYVSLHLCPKHDELLEATLDCDMFHYVGHGVINLQDPSLNGLLTKDEDPEKATFLAIRNLQSLRFREREPPLLAYLSICSMGYIDNRDSFNGGIDLMNACRIAGFRHVVGPLWGVSNSVCVKVALLIYQTLFEGNLDGVPVAWSLHQAIHKIRDEMLKHNAEALRLDPGLSNKDKGKVMEPHQQENAGPPLWAAFIHMGV